MFCFTLLATYLQDQFVLPSFEGVSCKRVGIPLCIPFNLIPFFVDKKKFV